MERISKTKAVNLLVDNPSHFYGVVHGKNVSRISDVLLWKTLHKTEALVEDGIVIEMRTAYKSSPYYLHFGDNDGSSLDLRQKNWNTYLQECGDNKFIVAVWDSFDPIYAEEERMALIYLVPGAELARKLMLPVYK